MDDVEEEEYTVPDSGLEMGDSIDSETHEDVDPFEELGIGSNSRSSTNGQDLSKGYDAFSELMNDGIDDSFDNDVSEGGHSKSDSLSVLLLQTVGVDGILDPAEVRLLSKKRAELNITFERHLELVEELIG